jgi:cytochrome c
MVNTMNRRLLFGLALAAATAGAAGPAHASMELAKKHNCLACHQVDKKVVGPSFRDVAAKHQGDAGAAAKLVEKVKKGGGGVYGPVPMPPNANVPDADIKALVDWVLAGAK